MNNVDDRIGKQLDQLAASTRSPRLQYSAGATRRLLDQRIAAWHRRRFLRVASAVAAVVVLGVVSWGAYVYATATEMRTISTLAETRTVQLPDGTQVVLNRHSSLSYPDPFDKKTREVTLQGEAYFAVSKNAEHPFIVQTGALSVRVLGTEFNVEAYPKDEQIRASLFEGSVAIDTENDHRLVLVPGECVVYDLMSKNLSKTQIIRRADEMAWQTGAIVFNNLTLGEIARRLSNLFNVEIRVANPVLAATGMSARFIHNESLDEMLLLLQEVGGFTVVKENQTIQFIINH